MTVTALAAGPLASVPARALLPRLRRLRIGLIYWWRHGHWPDLDRPTHFTEWVQWRKLDEDSPSRSRLTDKMHAKQVVAERGGAGLCVPTCWFGRDLPETCPVPFPVIVKANHGCNQYAVVRCDADWRAIGRKARSWLRSTYGGWLDERAYRSAQPGILVEPFVAGPGGAMPDDYKVYVFGGRAAIIQHHVGRGGNHRWAQFDRSWKQVGGTADDSPPPPNFDAMIAAAERLGAGHDFIRVDFYDVGGCLWFGEFCLYPGSGLDPFDPPRLDLALGELWSAARPD